MKLRLGLSGLAFIVAVSGCDMGFDSSKEVINPGIYQCEPENGQQGVAYKFDTRDKLIHWFGSNPGIEFFDLNLKKDVRLYKNSNLKYNCKPIDR